MRRIKKIKYKRYAGGRTRWKHHFKTRPKVQKKRFFKFKKVFSFLFLIIVVGGTAFFIGKKAYWFCFSSPTFHIKKIDVSGLQTISSQQFMDVLPVKINDSLIKTYFINFSRELKQLFPEIKSIRIKHGLPDHLILEVTERKPVACLRSKGNLYAVDGENVLFSLKVSSATLPEIIDSGFCNVTENSVLRNDIVCLLGYSQKNYEPLYKQILKLYYKSNNEIIILNRSDMVIQWGKYRENEVGKKLKYLNIVLDDVGKKYSKVVYIDLKLFERGRIILKPVL